MDAKMEILAHLLAARKFGATIFMLVATNVQTHATFKPRLTWILIRLAFSHVFATFSPLS
jgi:hypothetical protein